MRLELRLEMQIQEATSRIVGLHPGVVVAGAYRAVRRQNHRWVLVQHVVGADANRNARIDRHRGRKVEIAEGRDMVVARVYRSG